MGGKSFLMFFQNVIIVGFRKIILHFNGMRKIKLLWQKATKLIF
jgi:hypothetical protein